MPPVRAGIDRSKIKESVQSLYGSSWDTVYEKGNEEPIMGNLADASGCVKSIELSMESIAGFLVKEMGAKADCYGHSEFGMVIVELDSARARISIGESLIRKFKVCFEKHQVRREGLEADTDWIVVDLGNIFVHLLSPEARKEYDLEGSWEASRRSAASEDEMDSEYLSMHLRPKWQSQDPKKIEMALD